MSDASSPGGEKTSRRGLSGASQEQPSASQEQVTEALRTSIKETQKLRRRNRELLAAASEPIAIVGMSCRLPGGADSPQRLWDLLARGGDGLSAFPSDRGWERDRFYHPDPDHPGTTYVSEAGFLHEAGDFDAELFRLTPREALAMDPQQRLFLEASWEAFENAGIDPLSLRDTQTGVYAGVMYEDYPSDPELAGAGTVTSNTGSIVSGRVAYLFGLVGPTMTIDTACSSSLVALHLACGALRAGECSLALAGGVTVMSQPSLFVAFAMQRGLAPDGRCKSFADSADGTNWGEGVGVLALERFSDAQRSGRQVLGLIRGSAVNQDGASNGFASPNGPSQQRVIRQAIQNSGLTPGDIDAVEAHGTGTRLGDPIEAQALLATYGQDRPAERPLLLGSIKSNIGHVQAAAGVAGVIKIVQALAHESLPPTLHVDAPTSQVDWSTGAVKLLTEPAPWRRGERPRRAGVSSFGISGTNAHVILEEPPLQDAAPVQARSDSEAQALPWLLSAKSDTALSEQAQRLHDHLSANPELDPLDVAFSLVTGRAQLEHRGAVVGSGREELLQRLRGLARQQPGKGVVRGVQLGGKTAFMFTGQGAQRAGMGAELHAHHPVFASALDDACEQFDSHLPRRLKDLLFAEEDSADAELLNRTQYAQAGLFALEVALFRLVQSFGVTPDLVIGHSIGEVVAAHVAGVFSLADAARLVAARGGLMDALPDGGGMLAIEASETEVISGLGQFPGLSLAAVNGPSSVVVSGDAKAIEECQELWREEGRKTSLLRVSHAFHSESMEPMLEPFRSVLEDIEMKPPSIAIVSNVTGSVAKADEMTSADYWVRHVRETVRFAAGIAGLRVAGVTRFLELGPDGVLTATAGDCLQREPEPARALLVPAMRARVSEREALLCFLAEAHASGLAVDWPAMFARRGARNVALPTYPFQRRRFWHETWGGAGDLTGVGLTSIDHPMLGAMVPRADESGWTFSGRISLTTHPWLAGHVVSGASILPAAGFVELALAAGRALDCDLLEELTLQAPLAVPADGYLQLQLSVSEPDDSGRRAVAVYSRAQTPGEQAGEESRWVCHADGVLTDQPGFTSPALERLAGETWPPSGCEPVDCDAFYDGLVDLGLEYGPAFQNVDAAWRRGEEVFAEVAPAHEQLTQTQRFGLHPALLDAALHSTLLADGPGLQRDQLQLPFSLRQVKLHSTGASNLRVSIGAAGEQPAALAVLDENGAPVISVESLLARPVDAERLRELSQVAPKDFLTMVWQPITPARESANSCELVGVGDFAEIGLEGEPERRHSDIRDLIAALDGGAATPDAVLVPAIQEFDGDDLLAGTHAAAQRTRLLLQEWLTQERFTGVRLVLLSRGAAAVGDDETPELATAAVWGLLRSAQSEHPGRFQLVDLDPAAEAPTPQWAKLLACEEPQLALRDGVIQVPRLRWATIPPHPDPSASERADAGGADAGSAEAGGIGLEGTVLITGGTGGLGALVARHLAGERGARHLLLVSRRGAQAQGAAELVSELAALGCEATLAECDVSDRDALARLIEEISPESPLSAVIHTAGVVEDGLIDALGHGQLERVLRPKVDAALHLHELTEGMGLSHFVLFSSAASAIGSPGQSNYGAANAFMDALAARRHARGLAATSLAWGLWAEKVGMAGELEGASLARLKRLGVGGLSSEEGLRLFDIAWDSREPLLVPARLEMDTLRAHARAGVLPAPLRAVVGVSARKSRENASSLALKLGGVPETERDSLVLGLVRENVAAILGYPSADQVDPEAQFQELGVDSLAAVELRNSLDRATGLNLPATLVFDQPTPLAVAKFLRSRVAGLRPVLATPVRRKSTSEDPIAIVGMSCRYPGGVQSPEDLWRLVSSGVDAVSAFPEDRGWEVERIYHPDPEHAGTTYVNEGGFLYDATEFDAEFFQISPREATAMDPQQRLLLETAWEAFETAGIDPRSLRGSQTGVFAGVMYQDYGLGGSGVGGGYDENVMPGASASVVSGRVAYSLGLEGPAITVDTACSSSLVAMHLACQALRQDECTLALAGGVTIFATPTVYLAFSRLRGLAADGRCKPFSDAADGVGWSEGVGLLALERLSDARRLGHPVLGLVRGSAINQDGASNGFTAPNGPSQERVILQALANAQLSTNEVDVVEAHGTGTALGDPIEAQALMATYGRDPQRRQPLWLGSVKSNFGHTQAAAGVAGAIKMVMAMRHSSLPKTLHAEQPSRHIDWDSSGVALLSETTPWTSTGSPRRAGVSSFGISGTNVHVILEQAPEQEAGAGRRPVSAPQPFAESAKPDESAESSGSAVSGESAESDGVSAWVLSGRGKAALRAQAARLRDHLEERKSVRAADVALSLVCSRPALANRAVLVGEREQLLGALRSLSRGELAQAAVEGEVGRAGGQLAFLLTGGGAQRVGMGRELYDEFPAFREALEEVLNCFEDSLAGSLREAMLYDARAHANDSERVASLERLLDEMVLTQTVAFALEIALFRLVEHLGLRPDYLIGHSLGELVAVHVAGALSLADACRLVEVRGRLMGALPTGGAMVAVEASEGEIAPTLQGFDGRVQLAAVNGPRAVVLSGEEQAVLEAAATWEQEGRKTLRIRVSHASHSRLMEDMRADLELLAGELDFTEPRIPTISNLTGRPLTVEQLANPGYWAEQVSHTVRFADGVRWLNEQGVENFLELGPDGVLSPMCMECLTEDTAGGEVAAVPIMRRGRSEKGTLFAAIGALWTRGMAFDWTAALGGDGVRRVALPSYAFQRRRHWLGDSAQQTLQQTSLESSLEQRPDEVESDAGPLLRRLAGASPQERHEVVLGAVRGQLANTLGYNSGEDIDPHRSVLELGLDSVMAVDLRARLNRVTGLTMPVRVILDNPTALALAEHIEPQLERVSFVSLQGSDGAPCSDGESKVEGEEHAEPLALEPVSRPSGHPGTLTEMLGAANELGSAGRFMDLLAEASMFRPAFEASDAASERPTLVKLAGGDGPVELLCVPTVLAMSGPHQYVRFARGFAGNRSVLALTVPGFQDAERLPFDLAAAIEALASTVQERISEKPLALVGYSSGGWLAHALASRLESSGSPVEAVILLDTLPPLKEGSTDVLGTILGRSLESMRDDSLGSLSDDRLTAMGAYMRLLGDWSPEPITARTLLIEAAEELPGTARNGDSRGRWEIPLELVVGAGNHFTMIEDHAEETARAVDTWLLNAIESQGVEEVC